MSSEAEIKCINTDTPAMGVIYKIMSGMNSSLAVQTAIELEIFDFVTELESDCTVGKISEKSKYNKDAVERLLNSLCSLELLEKNKTSGVVKYKATPSGKLLAKKNPSTISSNIHGPGSFFNPQMFEGLADAIKGTAMKSDSEHGHGHSHGGHGHSDEGHGKESDAGGHHRWDSVELYRGMHQAMVHIAGKLVTAFDLSCHKSALDLGGGTGVLSYELRKQYPDMEVYLNDQENVLQIAKEHFYKGPNEHLNIKFLPGDFSKIEIPNIDLFVMSQVFHHVDNPGEFLDMLHKKLNPGGALLILESILNENKDGPSTTMMWDLSMLLHGGPGTAMRQRCASEYNEILTKHGFRDVKIALTQEYCQYDVIYAKKA